MKKAFFRFAVRRYGIPQAFSSLIFGSTLQSSAHLFFLLGAYWHPMRAGMHLLFFLYGLH